MTDATKPSLVVRLPSPLWLLGMIIVALLVDLPLQLPAVVQHRPAGTLLIAAGVLFSAWARRQFTQERAEIMPSSESHSVLVTSGPFRFSRNPMYLGLLVIAIGAALLAGTWLMWLVPVLLFVLQNFVIVPFEERSMERVLGDAYLTYKSRVRRWL
jgi:protein-S-isoprenylcysteine O-methyltransferase Ste14